MKKKKMPIVLKVILGLLGALLLVVVGYVLYLFISYHRLPDNVKLVINEPVSGEELTKVQAGEEYSIVTYNLGFGAYTPDFSFFMDGGESSVAESKESVVETINGAADMVHKMEPDFVLFQEVDLDSTRSYHVNQYEMLTETFDTYISNFAVNYDSAFLFYPFHEPHGKSKSSLATFSKYEMTSGLRRSLPISTSFSKFFDLDRCYSITRIPVEGGKELCLYNVHLSAYGNSDEIRAGQVGMLCDDMLADYEKGNYVICGGDFNHDLKNKEFDPENEYSWAYPFPREMLPDGFELCMDVFSEKEKGKMPDSARNADMEYVEGVTFTVTLDGYIVSDNVQVILYENLHTGYLYADHDPVWMSFKLK